MTKNFGMNFRYVSVLVDRPNKMTLVYSLQQQTLQYSKNLVINNLTQAWLWLLPGASDLGQLSYNHESFFQFKSNLEMSNLIYTSVLNNTYILMKPCVLLLL